MGSLQLFLNQASNLLRQANMYTADSLGFELKGITSFSGYLTSMMEKIMMKYEAFAKHIPLIEKIALDSDRVLLKDNKCNRITSMLFNLKILKQNVVVIPREYHISLFDES